LRPFQRVDLPATDMLLYVPSYATPVGEMAAGGKGPWWRPRSARAALSLALTLKLVGEMEPLPLRAAGRLLEEARARRGAPIRQRAVRAHIQYALWAGYLTAEVRDGRVCLRLTERGRELVERVFGAPSRSGAAAVRGGEK
jgi:hypothetical protein